MQIDPEALKVWVEASCAVQGVPVFVADPVIVSQVGSLVGAGVSAGAPAGARRLRASQVPDGDDSGVVEQAALLDRGVDGGAVQHGGHDRRLPLQIHRRPRLA
jgi:hypothetical protein